LLIKKKYPVISIRNEKGNTTTKPRHIKNNNNKPDLVVTAVIPATQEAEVKRITILCSLYKKLGRPHVNT
jgi:hypothetical protein